MSDIVVTELREMDRQRWGELWRGYLDFYETHLPEAIYDLTWRRLIAAESRSAASARGSAMPRRRWSASPIICSTTTPGRRKTVCYLQDLFVDASVRRHGRRRALIEAVAAIARERDCLRLYWTTKEDNATARLLYDRHRPVQRLHPLRLRAGLNKDASCVLRLPSLR